MNKEDLIIKKEYAEIKEIGKEKQEDCLRVYCNSYPNSFTFQIRTFNPLKYNGVNRQMIANVILSIDEVRKILKYMENEEK
jgi:hypothetical protein